MIVAVNLDCKTLVILRACSALTTRAVARIISSEASNVLVVTLATQSGHKQTSVNRTVTVFKHINTSLTLMLKFGQYTFHYALLVCVSIMRKQPIRLHGVTNQDIIIIIIIITLMKDEISCPSLHNFLETEDNAFILLVCKVKVNVSL
jgi:hypothetical protein